jgi:fumarate hydratase class II
LIEEAAGAGVVFGRPIVLGGAGGYLVMNVYKPLMMHKIARSIAMVTGCANLHKFPVEGTRPDLKKFKEYIERSLMLVTVLSPVIGYDRASKRITRWTTISRSRKRHSSLAWSARRSSIG